MTSAMNPAPAPTAGADSLIEISDLITDLGDAATKTQGPNGAGSDGKRYLYQ